MSTCLNSSPFARLMVPTLTAATGVPSYSSSRITGTPARLKALAADAAAVRVRHSTATSPSPVSMPLVTEVMRSIIFAFSSGRRSNLAMTGSGPLLGTLDGTSPRATTPSMSGYSSPSTNRCAKDTIWPVFR